MDSSEGSEKSLEERSLLDRTARPGTPLQRRLQREEGDRPDQEEEEGQQLYTMGDRDIEGEDNVATLRQEVLKARRERDSKVLYRGQAPSLDEADSYEIWVRKWQFWRNATSLTASQQAQDTIARIHNNHKIKPGLSDLLFRTLTEDQLSNPSCDDLKKFLDEQFNIDEYGEVWELFKAFIRCEIRPGEKIQDFTLRFDSAYKALIRKDPTSTVSERVKAMMLRDAAKLDTTALMSIRTNVKWKKDGTANGDVYKETIAAMNEICAGAKFKAPAVQQVKLVTDRGNTEIQYDGMCLYMDGQQMIPVQQHEMLMTQAKGKGKKSKKKADGEKTESEKTGQSKHKEKEKERLKGIKCFGCQKFGHYKSNCPEAGEESNIVTETFDRDLKDLAGDWSVGHTLAVEEDYGLTMEERQQIIEARRQEEEEEDNSPPRPVQSYGDGVGDTTALYRTGGASYQVNISHLPDIDESNSNLAGNLTMRENVGNEEIEDDVFWEADIDMAEVIDDYEDGGQQEVFVDAGSLTAKTFTSEADGAAGMDSCCTRTIMGKIWFESFKMKLTKKQRKFIKGPFKSETNFLFGNGGKKNSLGRYHLPLELHGCRAMMAVELVDSDIPLLISKPSMIRAGIVLDFCEHTTTVFGLKRNMEETSIGHPIIRVTPEGKLDEEVFQDEVLLMAEDGAEPEAEQSLSLPEKKKWAPVSWEDQKKILHKVHRQTGHHSKKKMLELLKNSSIQWDQKKLMAELDRMIENCEGCVLKKRSPCKPAASIPLANGFNQVVGVDLKTYGDGLIILYVIDFWSKLIQARVVKSKRTEDIISALLECWIAHYGVFRATVHDNGGEFIGAAFSEMCDLLGIEDKTGAAHSPWSYGIIEKHHGVVDKTFEALRRDFPGYNVNVLIQWAVMVKNSTTTATGWSPMQVVYGKNPVLPSLIDSNPAQLKEEVLSDSLMQNWNALNEARIKYNEALADTQLKRMLKAKVRRNQTIFKIGDNVYWKATNHTQDWRQGKVLAVDDKLLFVRQGSQLYRVHTNMAIRKNEEFDKKGKLITPPEVLETEARSAKVKGGKKKKPRRVSYDDTEDLEDLEDLTSIQVTEQPVQGEGSQQSPPGPGSPGPGAPPGGSPQPGAQSESEAPESSSQSGGQQSPDQSVETEEEIISAPPGHNYGTGVGDTTAQLRLGGANTEASISNDNTDLANSIIPEITGDPDSRPDIAAVVREQIRSDKETINKNGKRRAEGSPASKPRGKVRAAKVDVKVGDTIIHAGRLCRVESSGGKKSGPLRNYFNLKPMEGEEPTYGADLGRVSFTKITQDSNQHQALITMDQGVQEVFMQTIPYSQHGNLECRKAKEVELEKIVKQFKAVEEVDDVGQFRISCRFVLWYKKHSDGRTEVRSRLVARGFEEKDDIPSDSPTLDQTNLKVILMMAQARAMDVISVDVKAAFLQGLPLTERTVTVTPPPEAKVPKGKLWQLRVALYGLDDASLRFHWKVRQVMKELNLRQSLYDPALFYDKDEKTGRLRGIVGTHVDDFLLAGDAKWIKDMTKKIQGKFLLGTIEEKDYLYCGHRIKQDREAGTLTIDQEEFAREVGQLMIKPERKRQPQENVTEAERTQIRAFAGKLGWLGRVTRPDLLQAQIEASSLVSKATVNDLKNLSKAVSRVKEQRSIQTVPKLSSKIDTWQLKLYTDASWQNIDSIGSTAGKVIIVTDGEKEFPIFWSSNRLQRVCNSSQAAEVMALNEGLKDVGFIREMINELTGTKPEVTVLTDCKNMMNSVVSTTAPRDKKVRCELAAAREALMTGEVKGIKHITGKQVLADCLTKRGADSSTLLSIVQEGQKPVAGQGQPAAENIMLITEDYSETQARSATTSRRRDSSRTSSSPASGRSLWRPWAGAGSSESVS